jgi:hypothetical protein
VPCVARSAYGPAIESNPAALRPGTIKQWRAEGQACRWHAPVLRPGTPASDDLHACGFSDGVHQHPDPAFCQFRNARKTPFRASAIGVCCLPEVLMQTAIDSLIAVARKNGSRFDPAEYALFRKRLCEKRGDDAGAALWTKVASLIVICCW